MTKGAAFFAMQNFINTELAISQFYDIDQLFDIFQLDVSKSTIIIDM